MGKDFDSFFKELVRERMEEIPCPPRKEAWEQIANRLRLERKKQRRAYLFRKLKPIVAACIVIALISGLYAIPQTRVMALTNKIIKSIMVITGDTIKIYKKVDTAGNGNNPDYFFGRDIDDPRIGEAQKKVHFRVSIPEYIPKDFKLSSVDVLNKNDKKETVSFLYLNSINDKKDCFEIIQRSFPNDSDVKFNIMKDENTKVETINANGIEYTLVHHNEKLNGLMWDSGNIGYEISGNISKDDIIKIAKSMK